MITKTPCPIWLGVDGTNWVCQLWHALRGRDVLVHVRRRLELLGEHLGASAVIVCFDRRSFRHELAGDYKAGRAAKDPALLKDLAEAPMSLGNCGVPAYQDGYEADDCLATLAAIAANSGRRCVIASPDKDLWQCLVEGQVSVLRSFAVSGGSLQKPAWWTARDLFDAHGLAPRQWAEYQALCGESGDHVAGCPGWGPKTAGQALERHGSIAAMLANRWQLQCSRKQLAALETWAKTRMETTLQLIRMRTDVEAVADALR